MIEEKFSFRYAEKGDEALVLRFIGELARYERMESEVVATEELLSEQLFVKQNAEVLFALLDGREIGFALFFHNFSTFLGRSGLYLEDLFIMPEYRGRGFGRKMLAKLAAIARKRGYGRLEWCCLDWNEPSIRFYLSLNAQPMKDWTIYRVSGEALLELAGEERGK